MSCRASFHFAGPGQQLPRRGPGRRPWRRVLPMPVGALDRVAKAQGHGWGRPLAGEMAAAVS